ncbi:hypothetical protein A0H76_1526 [Hepatospora eriocheir]|uniref:Uncharacterized protein n=1 Tax=Hepatospora eriocheir TaxID=1081669 RepID=A0A1X0QKN1_9MICR|nr:hypothetical protein A0H76_1526 [Hepatospora eriocheir]
MNHLISLEIRIYDHLELDELEGVIELSNDNSYNRCLGVCSIEIVKGKNQIDWKNRKIDLNLNEIIEGMRRQHEKNKIKENQGIINCRRLKIGREVYMKVCVRDKQKEFQLGPFRIVDLNKN